MLLSQRFPGLPPETLPDQNIIKSTVGGARGAAIPKGCQAYPQEPPQKLKISQKQNWGAGLNPVQMSKNPVVTTEPGSRAQPR